MTVRPKAWERERQALSAHSAFTIWALFRVCGVVAVTDVLEGEAVERVSDGANAYMIERQADIDALRAANDASTDEDGVPSEGSSISLRDLTGNAKRYGIKLPFERAPFTESVVDDENLLSLVKMLSLSDQLTLDTYNTVVSLPGCVRMHWHADVDDPFDFLSRLTRTPSLLAAGSRCPRAAHRRELDEWADGLPYGIARACARQQPRRAARSKVAKPIRA